MLPEPALRSIIAELPRITVHGPWSRAVGYHLLQEPPPGSPPGSAPQPLWPGGARIHGARFTPRGGFPTIYLAADPRTALVEVEAAFQNVAGVLWPLQAEPWVMLSIDGVLTDVLDLTDQRVQERLGTTLQELTGDWREMQSLGLLPPTQQLARAALASGVVLGLRYTSAKNTAAGFGVAVFAERLTPAGASYLRVVDPHRHLDQRLPPAE